jgi:hypothetical protein
LPGAVRGASARPAQPANHYALPKGNSRKFIPTRKGRQALWLKMCEEGGVKPGDGIAVNPEDPSQALIVGPTIIANGGQQNHQPAASV